MKEFNKEYDLSQGKPHIFKMTLDDGFATYQYDINLNENWSMFDIQNKINEIVEKYGGTVTEGRLLGAGYLENDKENN